MKPLSTGLRIALGLVLPLVVLILWEALGRFGLVASHILPTPTKVGAYLVQGVLDGKLWNHVLTTSLRVLGGFTLGAGLGLPLGCLTGLSRKARLILDPSLQALRSIPSLAWVPLFLIWLGIGEESKIALIALGVFFPVYLNVTAGFAGVDRKVLELGRVLGYGRLALLWNIHLPAITPAIWTGLRGGLGLGWMFVVAAEILGASKGLGFLLEYGRNVARPEIIIASIVLFAGLGKLTDGILATLEKRTLVWRDTVQGGQDA